ncbi:MAG: UbiA family prenyltransferase, partial [Betaproteobacteria bacterium]|nr:UbiA family prenyltransferase [Betaproteobacteria bacterium]
MSDSALAAAGSAGWRDYLNLTKPRVVALIVFTAVVGMAAAMPAATVPAAPLTLLAAVVGIGLAASGAAAANCMIERLIDAKMQRTMHRPAAAGRISPLAAAGCA